MLKKFVLTYADFASTNAKTLLTKLAAFNVSGIQYDVTEAFATASGIPVSQLTVGNNDNPGIFCDFNNCDTTQIQKAPSDFTMYSDEGSDINAYFSIFDEGVTGADLTAGRVVISMIIIDYEA